MLPVARLLLAQELPEPDQLMWPLIAAGVLAVLGIVTWTVRAIRHGVCRLRALRARAAHWVQEQARAVAAAEQSAARAVEQTATSNGHKLGELAESSDAKLDQLTAASSSNRALIDLTREELGQLRDDVTRHKLQGH